MRILKNIFGCMAALGFCGLPGCIEFEEGWVQCFVLIIVGIVGFYVLNTSFYSEREHKEESRPQFLR